MEITQIITHYNYLLNVILIFLCFLVVYSVCKSDKKVKNKLLNDLTVMVKFFNKHHMKYVGTCITFIVDEFLLASNISKILLMLLVSMIPFVGFIVLCIVSNSLF